MQIFRIFANVGRTLDLFLPPLAKPLLKLTFNMLKAWPKNPLDGATDFHSLFSKDILMKSLKYPLRRENEKSKNPLDVATLASSKCKFACSDDNNGYR